MSLREKIQQRRDALAEGDSNDAEIDGLGEIIDELLDAIEAFTTEVESWSDLNHEMYAETVEPGVSDDSVLEAERDAVDHVLALLDKHNL